MKLTEAQINFARTRMAFSKKTRDLVKAKYQGRCGYCGQESEKLVVDHIHPVVQGHLLIREGRDVNAIDNLMPACSSCNNYKMAMSIEEFRREIHKQVDRARKKSINFRLSERFGLIEITNKPVVFYFEQHLTAKQPKQDCEMDRNESYKVGDRVRTKDFGGGAIVETQAHWSGLARCLVAYKTDDQWGISPFDVKDIQPWREPLKAEFECEVFDHRCSVGDLALLGGNHVRPFIGKRTKVTIEEII